MSEKETLWVEAVPGKPILAKDWNENVRCAQSKFTSIDKAIVDIRGVPPEGSGVEYAKRSEITAELDPNLWKKCDGRYLLRNEERGRARRYFFIALEESNAKPRFLEHGLPLLPAVEIYELESLPGDRLGRRGVKVSLCEKGEKLPNQFPFDAFQDDLGLKELPENHEALWKKIQETLKGMNFQHDSSVAAMATSRPQSQNLSLRLSPRLLPPFHRGWRWFWWHGGPCVRISHADADRICIVPARPFTNSHGRRVKRLDLLIVCRI